jgi:predicted amidophosphoribosyltransferase
VGSACDRCGLPLPGTSEQPGPARLDRHGCWPVELPVVATVAAYRYVDVVATSIATAKARAVWEVWPTFGERLGRAVRAAAIARVDVVTWVPSDQRRLKERGVDHAGRLAAGVAGVLGRPMAALLRAGPRIADQASLPAGRRRALPDDAFRARGLIGGARVLLVDDVLTTGATVRAAVLALVAAGADPVRVAVLARAGGHPLGA